MDQIAGMKTFVTVVDAGSFTAAGERLGLSKKLVSKYVAQLEDRLGARLLHRTTRRMSLTEAGERYYPRCTALLDQFDALEDTVLSEGAALKGTLRIAAPSTFGELYVQPIVRRFHHMHPALVFEVRLSDRYVDLVEERFDVAIRIGLLRDSSLISRRLATTELWTVAAPDYLRANGTPSTPQDLMQHECIRDANLRSGAAWPYHIASQEERIAVKGSFVVDSAKAVRDLVLAGEGIGLCPDYVVAADVAAGRLTRTLKTFASTSLDIHAVFLSARHMPAKVRAFVDHLAIELRDCEQWESLTALQLSTWASPPDPARKRRKRSSE